MGCCCSRGSGWWAAVDASVRSSCCCGCSGRRRPAIACCCCWRHMLRGVLLLHLLCVPLLPGCLPCCLPTLTLLPCCRRLAWTCCRGWSLWRRAPPRSRRSRVRACWVPLLLVLLRYFLASQSLPFPMPMRHARMQHLCPLTATNCCEHSLLLRPPQTHRPTLSLTRLCGHFAQRVCTAARRLTW